MRTLRFAILAALCGGCHFDKLLNGSGGGHTPPVASSPATLVFTTQPQSTTQNTTITPPVQVTALDSAGNVLTTFAGSVFIAKGRDGSVLQNATLSGSYKVSAVNGVATFSDLRIDQVGAGYTLNAAVDSSVTLKESDQFNITPTVP